MSVSQLSKHKYKFQLFFNENSDRYPVWLRLASIELDRMIGPKFI